RSPPTAYYSHKLVKLLPQKRSITSVETLNYNPEFKRTKQEDSVTMSTAETVVPTVYGVCKPLGAEMKVVLSNREAQICDLLNDVAEHLKATRSDLPPVTLRIAGGWVRDKLLGKTCHDLDVAVSTMMGYDFAVHVNEYLTSKGYETRSIAKIDSNPDKSKHLETATTKLFDQEIDFVNLRNEIYNEDSRIPTQVTYGSPSEDAYRRDITINTLFFNVHTLQVEDYTKQGLQDLADGLIRTPLPAFKTFCDDPLRVLRCIRFAGRFGFEIADDIVQAVKDEKIKHALLAKISRERIGIEVDKMLRGPAPRRSLDLIYSFGLYDIVFAPPQKDVQGELHDTQRSTQAAKLVEWLSQANVTNLSPTSDLEQLRLLYLATNLIPYCGMTYTQKGRPLPAVEFVLRDSLKAKNDDVNTVSMVFKRIEQIQQTVRNNSEKAIDRADLGKFTTRDVWTTIMVHDANSAQSLVTFFCRHVYSKSRLRLAAGCEGKNKVLFKTFSHGHVPSGSLSQARLTIDIPPEAQSIINMYQKLVQQTLDYGIENCYTFKPILDGKTVTKLLSIKPGKVIGELLEEIMAWQLGHPSGTTEECQDFIKLVWQRRQQ
ncbi:hypothetical protein INT44_006868, partial [Umbelopsis vinacea]